MPLVFCELALAYPPAKVSDPNQRMAAANGQFLLVEREAYRRLGGHAASRIRCSKMWNWRFSPSGARWACAFAMPTTPFRTRMYRTTSAMIEGWTKNLALLFNNALATCRVAGARYRAARGPADPADRAVERALQPAFACSGSAPDGCSRCCGCALCFVSTPASPSRISRLSTAPFRRSGLPLFVVLLYRSWFQAPGPQAGKLEGKNLPG